MPCAECARPVPVYHVVLIGSVTVGFCSDECCQAWCEREDMTPSKVPPPR